MPKLPSLTDIVNSVKESEYIQPTLTTKGRQAVRDDWNAFKVARGGGKGLTMISGIDPSDAAFNAKIAKNAKHPDPRVAAVHEMGMSLAHATTSGIFDSCAGCKTAECEKLCNAESGHAGIGPATDNVVLRAQKIRSAYWGENPQNAGALAIMQSRTGARNARAEGLVPVMRGNMWSDVPWHQTNMAGPWVHDLTISGKADPEAIGAAKSSPMLTHSNYTKRTMNRELRPGEKEFDADNPSNYYETGSISEQTPTRRVAQRLEAGKTAQAPVWATPSQVKPDSWVMQDTHMSRQQFPSYDADSYDARYLDTSLGNAGKVGLLRFKRTPAFKATGYKAGPSSFIRPLNPDAPVGSPEGIPKEFAQNAPASVSITPRRAKARKQLKK